MQRQYLGLLACPACQESLRISAEANADDRRVIEGALWCDRCDKEYPVVGGLPRFVTRENYASGFGLEWNMQARTQFDSTSGLTISENRFFDQAAWPRDLAGEIVSEVGRGSGRFTEQAAKTGALLRTIFHTKLLVRPFTRHLDPDRLYALVKRGVDFMWPVAGLIRKRPKGHGINWRLMVADYSNLGLKGDALKEWAYLDTFDMLAPHYDLHVWADTFAGWGAASGFTDVDTAYNGHGVALRAGAVAMLTVFMVTA